MRQTIVADLKVECDPPRHAYGYFNKSLEDQAKELESWASEFNDFIRDHRSQDGMTLNVIRVLEDVCSHCKYDWELDERGCPVCCEQAMNEWEAGKYEAVNEMMAIES